MPALERRRRAVGAHASGTEPVIRVMGEGENQPFIEEIVDGIVDALTQAAA